MKIKHIVRGIVVTSELPEFTLDALIHELSENDPNAETARWSDEELEAQVCEHYIKHTLKRKGADLCIDAIIAHLKAEEKIGKGKEFPDKEAFMKSLDILSDPKAKTHAEIAAAQTDLARELADVCASVRPIAPKTRPTGNGVSAAKQVALDGARSLIAAGVEDAVILSAFPGTLTQDDIDMLRA